MKYSKNYTLDDSDYCEMVSSSYVRKKVNPTCQADEVEVARIQAELADKTYFVVKKGVAFWVLPNELRPVPMDIALFARFLGKNIIIQKHRAFLSEYQKAIASDYRAAPRPLSGEEMYELKAAFGKGETIVNVLTGEVIRL